mmetsp:Transcript_43428/g.93030  ORF Transcript_43428/g.93030 Transcript_43428/m.93030 type:complete len:310 (+) Transcript_43428:161-1090(+)|eukprot:CAMPEP_0194755916 /NCGR_PEP_ID=MMETSP0323_2-20130528/9708_1 /TAXON_ID=2866 ORGANISM="Crypthecodinium cohnii, Strain Seligo" /NCGR_SAMPLE_ID=MMETSP0323_2 /ASSEMBLY_ACC=CAM_ASM_000346 /LENGTH=309 /DNA_ID=CAMNT_0039675197 /DNA_START=49 /DNA_END=978 /DNA_ORIENTATION=+
MQAIMLIFEGASRTYSLLEKVPVLGRLLDIYTSSAILFLRATSASYVAPGSDLSKRPKKLLKLYEYEGCPYCRKVREALSHLDLDVEIRPCPKEIMNPLQAPNESRFRAEVKKMGLEPKFPILVDDNTGTVMQESEKIVEYLWKNYGDKATPDLAYKLGRLLDFMPYMMLPTLFRPKLSHGLLRVPSKAPAQPLELWSFESSPFARLVREALCVLEIPYTLRNIAHNAVAKRKDYRRRFGDKLSSIRKATFSTTVQVPLLIDPNTGVEMLESADIVKYLYTTYQEGPPVLDTWLSMKAPKHITNGPKSD